LSTSCIAFSSSTLLACTTGVQPASYDTERANTYSYYAIIDRTIVIEDPCERITCARRDLGYLKNGDIGDNGVNECRISSVASVPASSSDEPSPLLSPVGNRGKPFADRGDPLPLPSLRRIGVDGDADVIVILIPTGPLLGVLPLLLLLLIGVLLPLFRAVVSTVRPDDRLLDPRAAVNVVV
jgi:hypothetical protein